MRIAVTCILIVIHYSFVVAQEEKIYSTNRSTLYGIGPTSILDTYLSPIKYTGTELRIIHENNRMSKHLTDRLSIQSKIDFSLSYTENPSQLGTEYAAFVDWHWGYHYRFPVATNLKLLAGGMTYISGGAVYNSRNGNNPVSAKLGMGLAVSGMGLYNFTIKGQPFTARLQLTMPIGGMFFSPEYGQSYYEIFGLENFDHVFNFSSLHNLFVCKSFLTIDIPLKKITLRAGYQANIYKSNINSLKTEIYSHTFLIGFVSEFIKLKGKKQSNLQEMIKSAYY